MPGRQELDATEVDHTGVSFPSYRSQCGDDPDPEEQETSVSKKGETREGTEYKEMDNDPDETLVPADTLSGGRVSNEASSNNETGKFASNGSYRRGELGC